MSSFAPMSLDTRGIDPQRLLPQSLEDRLLGWLGRASGILLLAGVFAVWLSLVSWSVSDPSLTHATTAPSRNWLGPFGAILSDLLLQMLGVAAVFALIAPLMWGFELTRTDHIQACRTKVGFYPLAMLATAGALAALPTFAAWPLYHGFGGAVGDGVFRLTAALFALVSESRASLAASVLLFGLAPAAICRSIGVELETLLTDAATAARDWLRTVSDRRENARISSVPASRAQATDAWPQFSQHDAVARSPMQQSAAQQSAGARRSDDAASLPFPDLSWMVAEPDLGAVRPNAPENGERATNQFSAGGLPFQLEGASTDGDNRGGAFDLFTDAASRAIAARFAPQPNVQETAAAETPDELAERRAHALRPSPPRGKSESQWKPPSLNLLKRPAQAKPGPELSQTVMRGNARLLEDVLGDFGVKGEVKDIRPGPVVTLYELEPARGTKSSRVIGLADDMARSMSVVSVRAAVVPGRNAIGIELPNARREPVLLRELLEGPVYRDSDAVLPLTLGKGIGGEAIVADLASMPHLLVAGTTGSGKSVGINAFILSLLYRHGPEQCRMLMIDPKMLELSVYNGIPHLLTPVVTDPLKAVAALNWAVSEMEERYKRMAAISVRNIEVFNNRVRNARKRGELLQRTVQTGFDRSGQAVFESQRIDYDPLPHIVIVVDEFADLMIVAGKDVETAVQRLAQMARAAGIHLIMATQRPSVDIITGTIKANFPTRISFKVTSKIDSRTILNDQGAEQLLGQGDMLYSTGAGRLTRVHGPYVSDEEVEAIAEALRRSGPTTYVDGIFDAPRAGEPSGGMREPSDGDLYDRAVAIVLRDRKASTSYLQRRLSIGYNRAADLIERMEREGVISAPNGVGKRDILVAGSGSADAA